MLLRRYHDKEKEELEKIEYEDYLNETDELGDLFVEYSDLKVAELKELLDKKGIEYDSKAKKDELIKLLEGAE